ESAHEQSVKTAGLPLVFLFLLALPGTAGAQAPAGSALFTDHCATCHAGNDPRIPTVASLRQHTPESIVDALSNGVMRDIGAALSPAERASIAEFLTGRAPGASSGSNAVAARCAATGTFDAAAGASWRGWGPDPSNARFQTTAAAGLTPDRIPGLTLKWAFGM